MLKKSASALAVGIVCFAALRVLPYFPDWWIPTFAIAMVILGFFQIHAAILLSLAVFSLTLAYHAYGVFLLFLVFLIACAYFVHFAEQPLSYLTIVAAPLLANTAILGYPVPLEFGAVFLIPVLMYGKKIPIAAALTCLWTSVAGIIARETMIGNLLLGTPGFMYFRPKFMTATYHNIGWFFSKFQLSSLEEVWTTLVKLSQYLVSHPLIFLQAFGWAAASYVLSYFLELRISKNKKIFHVYGVAATAGVLIVLQVTSILLYPSQLAFPYHVFLASLIITGAAFFGLCEWKFHLENKDLPQRIQPTAATLQNLMVRETARRKEMSLEETMKMQSELREYIQKKFVRKTTALDIDIADSTKLKEGQSPEAILGSFTEYWKLIDLAALAEGGRLLNRAGDGAIYLFGEADQAVEAAKQMLKDVEKFNKKLNKLSTPFRVRIGLNNGEIMEDLTKKGADVFSHVLDIAGHLQKMASPGEIIISDSAYQELGNKKDFEPRGISEKDGIPVHSLKAG